MQLLVVIINDREKLTPILDKYYELGIRGATVIDSHGMGHLIADHFPFFKKFGEINDPKKELNYTIFSVIKSEDFISEAIDAVEQVIGDLEKENTGFVFTLPIDCVKGFAQLDNC